MIFSKNEQEKIVEAILKRQKEIVVRGYYRNGESAIFTQHMWAVCNIIYFFDLNCYSMTDEFIVFYNELEYKLKKRLKDYCMVFDVIDSDVDNENISSILEKIKTHNVASDFFKACPNRFLEFPKVIEFLKEKISYIRYLDASKQNLISHLYNDFYVRDKMKTLKSFRKSISSQMVSDEEKIDILETYGLEKFYHWFAKDNGAINDYIGLKYL